MTTPELEAFRTELIQTAAVIVSALEDIDYGMADSSQQQETPDGYFQGQSRTIVNLILEERRRQDAKWGPQHHRMADWLAIIGEEYGKACMAYVDDLLMPTILEQKRVGIPDLEPQSPVQWGEPPKSRMTEIAEMMDLGTEVTDFLERGEEEPNDVRDFLPTGKLTRTRVPDDVLADRAARRQRGEVLDPLVFEIDVDPADELKGVFDRLKEEVEDVDPNEGRYDRQD